MSKLSESQIEFITEWARDNGERVVADGKTIWGGLGNRAGLHDYANTLMREKWEKSGPRFLKKLETMEATKVELQEYREINRDRGFWKTVRNIIPNRDAQESIMKNTAKVASKLLAKGEVELAKEVLALEEHGHEFSEQRAKNFLSRMLAMVGKSGRGDAEAIFRQILFHPATSLDWKHVWNTLSQQMPEMHLKEATAGEATPLGEGGSGKWFLHRSPKLKDLFKEGSNRAIVTSYPAGPIAVVSTGPRVDDIDTLWSEDLHPDDRLAVIELLTKFYTEGEGAK
jgi:hypothetical protein